jgi:hypothetical protein
MSEMPETPPTNDENLAQEFQNLGKNLVQALRAAWESPDFKRVQGQVVNSVSEMGSTLKREADNFATSSAGQQVKTAGKQIKTEVGQVGEKLRSSETQEKVQRELLNVLRTANSELQKAIDRWSGPGTPPGPGDPPVEG